MPWISKMTSEQTGTNVSGFRAVLAKIFVWLTILSILVGALFFVSDLYFSHLNYTYLLLIYCYIGIAIVSSPLIGYYLVRATDLVTFVLLLLGICGFVMLSLFSWPLLFEIAKSHDWVYTLLPYLGAFYVVFSIAFATSALVRRRISIVKGLAPLFPLLSLFVMGIVSKILSAVLMNVGQYATFGMVGVAILNGLILLGAILFSLTVMCKTIFSEANRKFCPSP